jgi:hypothetical protein
MLSPRLTNCVECTTIPVLINDIDCKLAELANNLYNNVVFMLNQPVSANVMIDLLNYRRILTFKYCNPDYAGCFTVPMIASKVKRLTIGKKFIPRPTCSTTTTTSSSSTTTTTTTFTYTLWNLYGAYNPYYACQGTGGWNLSLYTAQNSIGNGTTFYTNPQLTVPYNSNQTGNILSINGMQYFLGDNGGATVISSGSCQGFTTTTTTTTG